MVGEMKAVEPSDFLNLNVMNPLLFCLFLEDMERAVNFEIKVAAEPFGISVSRCVTPLLISHRCLSDRVRASLGRRGILFTARMECVFFILFLFAFKAHVTSTFP